MNVQERWYQRESHDAFFDFIMSQQGNPIVAVPTGAGKSIIIARSIQTIFNRFQTVRVLMLVHNAKLVQQNYEKLVGIWPYAPVGIYCADLARRQTGFPITFGTVQSIHSLLKKDPLALGRIDLIIVDECHSWGTSEDAAYNQVYSRLYGINSKVICFGLSATPYRQKMGKLTDGGIFTDIIYDLTSYENFNRLVDEGFLAPLVSRPTDARIDTSSIRLVAGEYNAAESEAAANEIANAAVQETIYWGATEQRKSCLVFAAGVDNAEYLAELFAANGVTALTVHSKKKKAENDAAMLAFENGESNVLVSMAKLTTGYDNPKIDLIADFQPTNSTARHVQKNGRGTRPSVGKQNCRVLDYSGNIERIGPINDPIMPRKPGEKVSGAPIKICPKCGAYNHASIRQCGGKNWQLTREGCGYEFPFNTEERIVGQASSADIMRRDEEPVYEWFKVNRVLYSKFQSQRTGAPPCAKISYVCGVKSYDELQRPEHGKALTERARQWWHSRSGGVPMPESVDDWLTVAHMSLVQPKRVQVIINRKYPEVVNYEF